MASVCVDCRSSKCDSVCGLCEGDVCRKCVVFLSEEEFAFVEKRPPELQHTYYCGGCYSQHVEPFKTEYDETIEKAKQITILYKGSKSSVRVKKKAQQFVQVSNMADRDEAILKLAYYAAREDYNAVIDVEVSSQKVRNEGYQTSAWSARGLPAEISSHELSHS